MRGVVIALLVVGLFLAPPCIAQNDWDRTLGNYMAQRLLKRLANPKDTDYRVGIINTAAEVGALVSPKGAFPASEFFAGANTWLSRTATEQLSASADVVKFEVTRKTIDAETCPEFEQALNGFYTELDKVLHRQISLSDLPPKRHTETITLDGTSYVLQIWTGERILAIYPDPGVDLDLNEASRVLLSTIGECSNSLRGSIEEHYGL